jgi:delta(3,5)-delta(2,4)-dienoyl-CoA isomerase
MLSCDFFSKFPNALAALDQKPDVNVVVHFCADINLTTLGSIFDKSLSRSDRGGAGKNLQQEIKFLQDAVTSIERCRKPMIAAIVRYGHAMEVALMSRRFSGSEAKDLGLVSNLLENEIFSYCGSKDCWFGFQFYWVGLIFGVQWFCVVVQ